MKYNSVWKNNMLHNSKECYNVIYQSKLALAIGGFDEGGRGGTCLLYLLLSNRHHVSGR